MNGTMTFNTEYVSSEVRTYPYKGNKAFIERKGPFGFWFVRLERGEVPEKLKEVSYTTVENAAKAIFNEEQRSQAKKPVQDKV
jgi:hypothetical protein